MADIPQLVGAVFTGIAGSKGIEWGFRWLRAREERLGHKKPSQTGNGFEEKLALERRLTTLEHEIRNIKDNTNLINKTIETMKDLTLLFEEFFKPRLEDHEERLRDMERRRQ